LPVPDLDDAAHIALGRGIVAAANAHHASAVRAELDAAHRPARRHLVLRQRLTRLPLPHAHHHVAGAAGDILIVRPEPNALPEALVPLQHALRLARAQVPDAGGLVAGRGRQEFAVGAESQADDRALVAGQIPNQIARLRAPYLGGLILRAGGD